MDAATCRSAIRINWILIGVAALLLAFAAHAAGFDWHVRSLFPVIGLNAAILGFALVLGLRGLDAYAHLFHAIAQIAYCSMVGSLLSVVLASTDAPVRDTGLIMLDRWIGFDWKTMIGAVAEWPRFTRLLNYSYASLAYQPLPLLLLLAVAGRVPRANILALAWTITLAITIMIFPFVPALGGYLHYGIPRGDVPEVQIAAAWLYVDVFEGARSGALRMLGSGTLDGVITFPSFHAAAAVLLAWGFYGIPWLRWPGVGLNALMVASTPVIGGHYLVDTLAGIAVAALGILVARQIVFRSLARVHAVPAFGTRMPRSRTGGVDPDELQGKPRDARRQPV
jgi:membrane-associated phospholipid phosphatase